jgi:lysyl-tRNA synthetase class 2
MEETNQLIEQRKANLRELEGLGVKPFANKFTPSVGCAEARAHYEAGDYNDETEVMVAGRITAHRDMGKSQFLDLRDGSGRIQIFANAKVVGEDLFKVVKCLDLGDFISVKALEIMVVSKALRPLPAKWHGLEDTEVRYRQRYLDLVANEGARDTFLKRSAIIREIRNFLHSRGYIEVETPMMQAIPGGAAATPFVTQHNALGCQFYLRIALELYLKRLLVGGMDRVFEIGRNFRNEGLSRRHNPEFTMLEAYEAYGDYETMMNLLEGMVCHVATEVLDTLVIEHKDGEGQVTKTINLTPPWRRAKYKDLVREKAGEDWFDLTPEQRRERALNELKLQGDIENECEDFEVTNAVFEKLIEPTLIQPTFVTHLPKELIPLAKASPDDPDTVEVFECCINGQEIAPAYSEQNDPIEQRERLEHQAGEEQQKLDDDFLVALEHGMPPAGGIGIGIDRLCMMLLGQESIRDVILFPQLRPKS